MTTSDIRPLPSLPQLWKATGVALLMALTILITAVLPAEHGIDPTGIGRKLGLGKLAASTTLDPVAVTPLPLANASDASATPAQSVVKSSVPFRSGEMALTLPPGEGAEIKAVMEKGDQFFFAWHAEGKVDFDMHGEARNARSDEFTSYWKGTMQTDGHGSFTALFDGTHGWYWHNWGNQPVTVRVKVSGFYEKLYRPQ